MVTKQPNNPHSYDQYNGHSNLKPNNTINSNIQSDIKVQDSTGLNFEFKDKIQDSGYEGINTYTYGNPAQSNYGYQPTTTTSNMVETKKIGLVSDAYNHTDEKMREVYKSRGNNSNMSNKDVIEFGDVSDRQAHLLSQNRELKELIISKENQINNLKLMNMKMEKELQNLMDPLSKNSQLKDVMYCYINRNTKRYSSLKIIRLVSWKKRIIR